MGRGRGSDHSRGGGGEGEEKPGFYDGLEPRKGHRYNLFLMRNITLGIKGEIIGPSLLHWRRESSGMTELRR